MRRLAVTLVLLVVLVVPVTASADVPPTVVAACQAEYAQLGADAFAAKYGPTEAWGHCYAQHLSTTPPPATTVPDSPAAAACKAEYVQLGPTAFAARMRRCASRSGTRISSTEVPSRSTRFEQHSSALRQPAAGF